MKNRISLVVVFIVVIGLTFMAFRTSPPPSIKFEPIMMSRADLEASFAIEPAREIEKPGKLWVYNNFIMLIEQYRGIHIIDNSDPNNPQRVAFIRIEGCTEVAVREGILYANNAVDLVGVKATADFSSLEIVSRNRDVMPVISSPEPWDDEYYLSRIPDDMIIVRWEPRNN
jgi:hypothetical protein